MYKYTVIIPCYQESVEDFKACLDSIKNQTKKADEVIIVNDCGKKEFGEIVESYGYKYVYHKENLNNGGARNTAMRMATGDYLIFCNADDTFHLKTIESIDEVNKGQDLIIVGIRSWCKNRRKDVHTFIFIPNANNTPLLSKKMLYGEPMHVVNRQFILDNDLFEIEHLSICDVDWTTRLEKTIKTYAYVPKALYNWQVGHK